MRDSVHNRPRNRQEPVEAAPTDSTLHAFLSPPVAALLLLLALTTLAGAAERQVLRGHVPAVITNRSLQPLGQLPTTNRLNLAIGLPLRHQEVLKTFLQHLYDPASPQYRQYLTPEEFAERFGPTEQDYQTLIDFVTANGLTVTGRHPNRVLLDVKGSVANIEKSFHLTMRVYQHPTEARTFYAPDVEPSLDLAVPVLNIGGLNNYAVPHPKQLIRKPTRKAKTATPNAGSGPGGAYMGYDFRAAYLPGVTDLTGARQVVGLVEFDGYYPNDIATYETQTGLPSVPLDNVLLDGFNGVPTTGPNSGNGEVALDIEMSISMAPGLSKVIVYEAGPNGFANDVLSRMASDNQAQQLSCSWSFGVDGPDATVDQLFQQLAAQGQSFFDASGDTGAYTGSTAAEFPSDDPYITQVGGTTLTTTGPGGNWVSETVWNDGCSRHNCDTCSASSGGISTSYSIPSYQQGISMSANQGSTTMRNIPDVAMVGDSVAFEADNGQQETGVGTSFATPLWAGFIALVNQQAAAYGQPPVGFLNPAIYRIGTGANYTSAFHDITTGNNTTTCSPDQFFAVAGYDLCTGWGTPNGGSLIAALTCADTIATSSAPSGGGSTSGGGTVYCGADVTVTATPNQCYNFSDWTENGVSVSTSPNYTFTAVANATLVANFTQVINVLINTDSSPVEGGIASGGGSVTCGSSVTVSAAPSEGYSFVNWTEGGAVVGTSSNYTFTATGDGTLVANFLCSSSILPTNASFDAGGGDGTVTVTDALDCVWTASSSADWIAILSETTGSIGGTVSYTVASNTDYIVRTGTMTIAGQTFTVSQAASLDCFFLLNPTSITLPAKGDSKTVKVESYGIPCDWTAVSNDPFITITEGASGTGNGKVDYTVPGNTNTGTLSGTMTIAGLTFTVKQDGGGCTFKLSPKHAKFKAAGGRGTVKVTPNFNDCAWTASTTNSWITITPVSDDIGKGTVTYTIPANTSTNVLTGTMTIAGEMFTVTQSGEK
ncbi:MAG: protease pro-enzyme activation domain-containing protein [Verrucomicrobiia bacterium]